MTKKLPKLVIKKQGKIKNIDGKIEKFKIVNSVDMPQKGYPEKRFILQELLFETGKKRIRIGYYIIGKKPKMKGKWVWGQSCPMFPEQDIKKLLEKAKSKGIINY